MFRPSTCPGNRDRYRSGLYDLPLLPLDHSPGTEWALGSWIDDRTEVSPLQSMEPSNVVLELRVGCFEPAIAN